MHEGSDERKEEKLEEREIVFRPNAAKSERPHGKVYRWLDNFWYHHKWKTIIITFFAVVILICALQMCNREETGDISVLIAGPTGFMDEEAGLSDIRKLLALELPADYDGNGEKTVDAVYYTVFSEEQVKAYLADGYAVNTATNANTYSQVVQYVQTGESSVLLLDPWIAENLKNALLDAGAVLGYVPEGAVTAEVNGQSVVIGVRLGDTELYRENAAMQKLSADTVICIAAPVMGGKSDDDAVLGQAKEFYKALVN